MADFCKSILPAMLLALALSSCSRDLAEVAPTASPSPYVFSLANPGTRTLLESDGRGSFGAWESGDRIGTFVAAGASLDGSAADVTPGTPSTFTLYRSSGFEGGELLYAYYPYSAGSTDPHSVEFSIPASQSQSGTEFDFDAMPLASVPVVVGAAAPGGDCPIAEVAFLNLASMARFRIFSTNSSYASETVTSVSFSSSTALAGSFSMDITAIDPADASSLELSGYATKEVTTSVSGSPATGTSLETALSVFMVLAPGTYTGTVTVVTDKAEYVYTASTPQTFVRSVIRGLGIDLGTCTNRTSTQPAQPVTVTKTIAQMIALSGYTATNGQKYEVLKMDDVITVETSGYNNCGNYYSSGSNWRIYSADYGNIKIKAAPGYELRSVTMVYTKQAGSGGNYPDFDGPASGTAQAVSGCSVTYHVSGSPGHLRITRFTVTYIASSFTPSRAYLDCYEVPAIDITVSCTGNETFGDDEGTGIWHGFDLPNTGLRAITHTYLENGGKVRNYTTLIDKEKRCPLWSAYPMHGTAYADNDIGRSGSFNVKTSFDPAIPASWQSAGSTDGGSGSYSRGHLCASEDRQSTYAANCQTFYYTNQAPQWQSSFNSGVWSSLESAVQKKAASLTARDTLYVVSGTLYEDDNWGDSNGLSSGTTDGLVARPSHFYKLLMLCSFDESGTMTAARGAAYLYTNAAHSGVYYYNAAFKTTIDAIEARTGFDFFPRVPSSLQASAESSFYSVL